MSSLEDLEQRIAALEDELAVVRQEAAAARALAAGADRDVTDYRAELRGHTRVLNALRATQLDQDAVIGRVEDKVDQLTGTVGHIRDQHGASLAHIAALLGQLIDRDNEEGSTSS